MREEKARSCSEEVSDAATNQTGGRWKDPPRCQDFLYKHEEPGGILGREARRPELCLAPPLTEALRMPKGR